MNVGLTGGGFTALFYGLSIFGMFIREILFFSYRWRITPELRLACEQMFYLVAGVGSLALLYQEVKSGMSAYAHPVVGTGIYMYVQEFTHFLVGHAMLITITLFVMVWSSIALVSYLLRLFAAVNQKEMLRSRS
jgi:hypothetical protein